MRYLSSLFLFFLLVSCRSLDPTTLRHATQHYTTQHNVTHDTVYLRDSVYVSERQRGDTVYLTRVEWRDRWRTRMVHDTIHETQYIEKIIEKPPEKYIPNFYKHCTIYFWCAIFCILLYIVLRLTKSKLRMRFWFKRKNGGTPNEPSEFIVASQFWRERYVPKFYRWCTGLLFALLTWVTVRWWLRTKRYFLDF